MKKVAVGNEYKRKLGAVNMVITITGFDEVSQKWTYLTKSGKKGSIAENALEKCELLKGVEEEVVNKAENGEYVKVYAKRLKNAVTCTEAAIATLVARNVPMNAKELVIAMKADNAFAFSPNARTPWNSVGTKLTQYMHQCEETGEECRIKQIKRGVFAHAGYEVEA